MPEPGRAFRWLDERTGIGALLGTVLPRQGWLAFGPLLAILVGTQLVTGVLLLFYYTPHPGGAFESVQQLMLSARGGWVVRLFHAHAASLLIALIVIRVSWSALTGFYREPRQLSWTLLIVLMTVALGAAITGYTLPWSQVSYWGVTIVTAALESVPLVGDALLRLTRGGEFVSERTLTRSFAAHIAVLAPLVVLLTGLYLRVRIREESIANGDAGAIAFFPGGLLELSAKLAAVLCVLLALAVFVPDLFFSAGHETPADPFATPESIKPEWYMLWGYQLTSLLPDPWSLVIQGLGFGALAILPLVDRSTGGRLRGRVWVIVGVTAGLLGLVLLSIGGAAA